MNSETRFDWDLNPVSKSKFRYLANYGQLMSTDGYFIQLSFIFNTF